MSALEQVVGQLLARQQEAMEKQHQLMERLINATQGSTASNGNGSSTPSATVTAPETLMDILAKNYLRTGRKPNFWHLVRAL